MRPRSLILRAWEVRAILHGRLTQIRRPLSPHPKIGRDGVVRFGDISRGPVYDTEAHFRKGFIADKGPLFGVPGDTLIGKETWINLVAVSPATGEPMPITGGERLIEPPTSWTDGNGRSHRRYDGKVIAYRANSDVEFCDGDGFSGERASRDDMPQWRSAVCMPREYSRVTLEVTASERVERLHDITEDDAWACGAFLDPSHPWFIDDDDWNTHTRYNMLSQPGIKGPHTFAFAAQWDADNGKRFPWSSNPWVRIATVRSEVKP